MPILLVPQLWIWRIDNFIVSAFASKDLLPHDLKFYSLSLASRSPDLQMGLIIADHIQAFGSEYKNDGVEFPPTLNIFEMAVVSLLSDVDEYMNQNSTTLNLKKESEFIHEISDIQSELFMIQDVLNQQEDLLKSFIDDCDQTRDGMLAGALWPEDKLKLWDKVHSAQKNLDQYRKRIGKINRDAERIEQVIQNKLNLRRTAASMEQANASISEAHDSKMLSLVVIGFTLVTIFFTPLSFLASLFALEVDSFGTLKYSSNETKSTPAIQLSSAENSNDGKDVYSGKKLVGIFGKHKPSTRVITLKV